MNETWVVSQYFRLKACLCVIATCTNFENKITTLTAGLSKQNNTHLEYWKPCILKAFLTVCYSGEVAMVPPVKINVHRVLNFIKLIVNLEFLFLLFENFNCKLCSIPVSEWRKQFLNQLILWDFGPIAISISIIHACAWAGLHCVLNSEEEL